MANNLDTSRGLQIWMPMTKDLHNLGLAQVSITNNGATYSSTGGKLGGCYELGSDKSILTSDIPVPNSLYTICCWFKYTEVGTLTTLYIIDFAVSSSSNTLLGILKGANNTFSVRYNSSTTSVSSATVDTWYHLAATYDGTTIRVYVNGAEVKSLDVEMTYTTGKLGIGLRPGSTSYYPTGAINDVRVYSYALGANEIKELARGCVGHWLCEGNGTALSNLIDATLYVSPKAITIRLYYTSLGYIDNNFFGLKAGDTVTYSFRVTSPADRGTYARILFYTADDNRVSVAGNTIPAGKTGISLITFTLTDALRDYTLMQLLINSSNTELTSNVTAYVSEVKLERGEGRSLFTASPSSQAFLSDISGFGRHSTSITGTVALTSDTKRYDKALLFTPSSSITLPNPLSGLKVFTFSTWIKFNSLLATGTTHLYFNLSGIRILQDNVANSVHAAWTDSASKTQWPLITNTTGWHHIVLISDGSTIKCYLDGNTDTPKFNTTGLKDELSSTIVINPGTQNFTPIISDIRLYATALDSTAIQELYSLGNL